MSTQDCHNVICTITQTTLYFVQCDIWFRLVAVDPQDKATLWACATERFERVNLSHGHFVECLRQLADWKLGATMECHGLVFKFGGPPSMNELDSLAVSSMPSRATSRWAASARVLQPPIGTPAAALTPTTTLSPTPIQTPASTPEKGSSVHPETNKDDGLAKTDVTPSSEKRGKTWADLLK